MRISKRTGTGLLILAIISSFLARYPLFKVHNGGFDSEMIFYFSKSISNTGMARWVANPTSYFGLHRFSYPQGTPFLFSSFIQISGESSEVMIFLFDLIIVSLAVISAFLLGLTIRKRDYLFAFLSATIFGMAPAYVYVTAWSLSARGLFMAVFSIMILISFFRMERKKKHFLLILFGVMLFSIHRMSFFLLITLLPAYLVYLLFIRDRTYAASNKYILLAYKSLPMVISIIVIIVIYTFLSGLFTTYRFLSNYGSGRLISGSGPLVILINLGVTFAVSAGIPIVFSFVSIYDFTKRRHVPTNMAIMLIFLMFSLSMLFYKDYFRIYSSLILSVFAAFSMAGILYFKAKTHRFRKEWVYGVLVASLVFSVAMQGYWNGAFSNRGGDYMDYSEERSVVSIKDLYGENVFSTAYLSRMEIAHTNGSKFMMPFVKEEDPYYECAVRGYLSPEDLQLEFKPKLYSGKIYLYLPGRSTSEIYSPFSNSSLYDYYVLKDTDNGTFINDVRDGCYIVYSAKTDNYRIDIYTFDRGNEKIANKKVHIH